VVVPFFLSARLNVFMPGALPRSLARVTFNIRTRARCAAQQHSQSSCLRSRSWSDGGSFLLAPWMCPLTRRIPSSLTRVGAAIPAQNGSNDRNGSYGPRLAPPAPPPAVEPADEPPAHAHRALNLKSIGLARIHELGGPAV
jgi:hypothetical protein